MQHLNATCSWTEEDAARLESVFSEQVSCARAISSNSQVDCMPVLLMLFDIGCIQNVNTIGEFEVQRRQRKLRDWNLTDGQSACLRQFVANVTVLFHPKSIQSDAKKVLADPSELQQTGGEKSDENAEDKDSTAETTPEEQDWQQQMSASEESTHGRQQQQAAPANTAHDDEELRRSILEELGIDPDAEGGKDDCRTSFPVPVDSLYICACCTDF